MKKNIRIGTRDSQLAAWQATLVQQQLQQQGTASELVYIKSEGDLDLVTPLYEMGVQGIFTKTLDAALLNSRIDIAVHSMKDVPTQLAKGIQQAAVLTRASYKDLLVYKGDEQQLFAALEFVSGEWSVVSSESSVVNKKIAGIAQLPTHHSPLTTDHAPLTIATSSIRRKAQWLHRYPHHQLDNLRGNVNTRMQKLADNNWDGAIFAAAGLERIGLRPTNSIELDWMLPAPSQGAIMIVCREDDKDSYDACSLLNDAATALCTKIEKDFLRVLMGGCSTPISALAELRDDTIYFQGNILSLDGKDKATVSLEVPVSKANDLGTKAANELLRNGGDKIREAIRNAGI